MKDEINNNIETTIVNGNVDTGINETISSSTAADISNINKSNEMQAEFDSLKNQTITDSIKSNETSLTNELKANEAKVESDLLQNQAITDSIESNKTELSNEIKANEAKAESDSLQNQTISDSLSTEVSNTVSNQSLGDSSSTDEIFFDYDQAKTIKARLTECNEKIYKDIKELQSLLENLGTYWSGSKKEMFVTEIDSYISAYNQYNNILQAGYEGLEKANNSYSNLNDVYASETI